MAADEKTCPRCAETVKSAALICRFCGHEFGATYQPSRFAKPQPPAPTDEEKNKRARNSLFACIAVVFLIALIGQCGTSVTNTSQEDSDTNTSAESSTDANSAETAAPAPPVSDWFVSADQDEMRGKPAHYATVTSENAAYFDFPYNGGSKLTMTVRRHPRYGDDVVFQISKGQFVCRIDDCFGTINYGKGHERISLNEPADYDSETLFAASASGVIKKLKVADKVIVELPFYQEGNRQFTFKTHGLVWPPKEVVTK